jgi:hypothetical protein
VCAFSKKKKKKERKKKKLGVAAPSYLKSGDWENHSLKPEQAKSL